MVHPAGYCLLWYHGFKGFNVNYRVFLSNVSVKCFNCGESGHISKNCKKKSSTEENPLNSQPVFHHSKSDPKPPSNLGLKLKHLVAQNHPLHSVQAGKIQIPRCLARNRKAFRLHRHHPVQLKIIRVFLYRDRPKKTQYPQKTRVFQIRKEIRVKQ